MRRLISGLAILVVVLAACAQSGSSSASSSAAVALANATPAPTSVGVVTDVASFAQALQARGAVVASEGDVALAFLHAPGSLLRVDDQQVQVYDYGAEEDARADAARFSQDGAWVSSDIGATLVNWFATPHLYRDSRLIVVYVGDAAPTLTLLGEILGAPFAGGANPYRAVASVQ